MKTTGLDDHIPWEDVSFQTVDSEVIGSVVELPVMVDTGSRQVETHTARNRSNSLSDGSGSTTSSTRRRNEQLEDENAGLRCQLEALQRQSSDSLSAGSGSTTSLTRRRNEQLERENAEMVRQLEELRRQVQAEQAPQPEVAFEAVPDGGSIVSEASSRSASTSSSTRRRAEQLERENELLRRRLNPTQREEINELLMGMAGGREIVHVESIGDGDEGGVNWWLVAGVVIGVVVVAGICWWAFAPGAGAAAAGAEVGADVAAVISTMASERAGKK